nr:reverse transcriptase domain-containing protein [Tanacetum cinerariifolium]
MEKFFFIFQDLHFDISFADALILMPKFASTIKSLLTNKDKLFELAKIPLNVNCSAMFLKKLPEKLGDPKIVDFEVDHRVPLILGRSFLRTGRALIDVYGEEITLWVNDEAEILGFSSNSSGGDPTSTFEPILSISSLSPTPFEGSDFILEEIDAYLKDESILLEIDHANCDPEGDICLIEKLLNDDSPWISPIHYVPKKGGITIVENENNGLIPTQPMTHLLEKKTSFVFSKDCINSFETLKKKLTEASILVVPDWNLPFELMCDASDFAIGAVLGQRKMKHFQPIHYASKTMTEAQIHYTTTEKEMLAVVYAFEKFRPYLVLSKSIVYTDHSALKYLLIKKYAKPSACALEILIFQIVHPQPFRGVEIKKHTPNIVEPELRTIVEMADNRTMEELL